MSQPPPEAPQSPLVSELPELPAGPVVADASFVLAVLENHSGAAALATAGVLARCRLLSVTWAEVLTVLARTGRLTDLANPPIPGYEPTGPGASSDAGLDVERLGAGLGALGVRVVDFPATAARHTPYLLAVDAARRRQARAAGEPVSSLSLGDRCVLGYALEERLPAVTGDTHWATLAPHGLDVTVHDYHNWAST